MSKVLIYSLLASSIGVIACATYFFPIVEGINSAIHSENQNKTSSVKPVDTYTTEVESEESTMSPVASTDLNPENPKVMLNQDSAKRFSSSKDEYNPSKMKLMEGEIPASKNF